MTKQEWLINRARILTGSLTGVELEQFYEVFKDKCVAAYKTIDFTTFSNAFTRWFANPVSFGGNGLPIVTPQNTIVNTLIKYMDAKYHVVYVFGKNNTLIKLL